MKFKDYFNLKMEEYGKALKGDKTDKDLDVALEAQILPDDRVIEYESLEVGKEVFLITKDTDPDLIKDETIVLSDGQSIVIDADGKISEINPKAEEMPAEPELSEEQKAKIALSEQVLPLKVELEALKVSLTAEKSSSDKLKIELASEKKENEKLKAQIVALQELNDEKNPLKKSVKLENEKPKTPYEIQIGA